MMYTRPLAFLAVLLLGACSTPPAEPPTASAKLDDAATQLAKPGKPEQREPEQREPEQREPEQREPEQREPEQREPEQREPEQREPEQPEPPKVPVNKIELRLGTDPCEKDTDCVKATCCHANACVSKDKAPSCSNAVCTLDCKIGTMDCGGGCLCKDGKCATNVWMGWEEPGASH